MKCMVVLLGSLLLGVVSAQAVATDVRVLPISTGPDFVVPEGLQSMRYACRRDASAAFDTVVEMELQSSVDGSTRVVSAQVGESRFPDEFVTRANEVLTNGAFQGARVWCKSSARGSAARIEFLLWNPPSRKPSGYWAWMVDVWPDGGWDDLNEAKH